MPTRKFAFGHKPCGIVLLLAVLYPVLARADSRVLAQSQPLSNYADPLKAKAKRFVEYGQDFVNFAKAASGTQGFEQLAEYEAATTLQSVAGETSDKLRAAITLLQVYSALSCEEDRSIVRRFVEREFRFYSQQIEISIDQVNFSIAYTKRPGVAAEAGRMRDDLREVKNTLDSMKLQ